MKIESYDFVKVFRWTVTVGLLWTVWHHTHWSVALSLTLAAMAIELLMFMTLDS